MKKIRLIANSLWAISLILLLPDLSGMTSEGTPLFNALFYSVYFFPSYTESLDVVSFRFCTLTLIAFFVLFLSIILRIIANKTARKKNYFFTICNIILGVITIVFVITGLVSLIIWGTSWDSPLD